MLTLSLIFLNNIIFLAVIFGFTYLILNDFYYFESNDQVLQVLSEALGESFSADETTKLNLDNSLKMVVFGYYTDVYEEPKKLLGLYNSSRMGISIQYPDNWIVSEEINNDTAAFYPPQSNSSIQIKSLPSYDMNLKEWTDLLNNLHTKLGEDFREEDSSITKYPTYSVTFSNYSYGDWYHFKDIIVLAKHMLVYINITYNSDEKYEFNDITQDMLKSLKIDQETKLDNQPFELTINKMIKINSGYFTDVLLETFSQPFIESTIPLTIYNNSKMGISLEYPINWHISEQKDNTVTLYPPYTFEDRLQIKILPSYDKSIRELLHLYIKDLPRKNFTDVIELNYPLLTKYPSITISYWPPIGMLDELGIRISEIKDTFIVTDKKLILMSSLLGSHNSKPGFFVAADKIIQSLSLHDVPEMDERLPDLTIDRFVNKIDNGHLNDTESEGLQIIASEDGNYIYVTWEDQNNDIVFTRSTDHGFHFQDPVILNDAGRDNGETWLQMSGYNNNVYLIWKNSDGISYVKSNDNGTTFSKEMFLTNNTNDKYYNPNIALFKDNVYIVASQINMTDEDYEKRNSYLSFKQSTDNGNTFKKTKIIYNHSDIVEFVPKITTSYNGTIYVSWINDDTGEVFFTKSTDNGDTFKDPINLFDGNCDYRLRIFAEQDNVYATCIHQFYIDNQIILFTRSIDGGNTFDKTYSFGSRDYPPFVYTNTGPLMASSNNTIYLAWSGEEFLRNILFSGDNVDYEKDDGIYLTKSDDNGTSFYPTDILTYDSDENTYLVDMKVFNDNIYILYNSGFADRVSRFSERYGDLILATSVDKGNTFDSLILNEYKAESKDARLAVTNNGTNVYIVWENRGIEKSIRDFRPNSIDHPNSIDLAKVSNDLMIDTYDKRKNSDKELQTATNKDDNNGIIKYCPLPDNRQYTNKPTILPSQSYTKLSHSEQKELEKYDNDKIMQFSYPQDWEIYKDISGRETSLVLKIGVDEEIQIHTGEYSPSHLAIDQFLNNYNITEIFFDELDQIQYYSTMLDNHPAIQIQALGEFDYISKNTTLIDTFTIVNNTLFDILYISPSCKKDVSSTDSSDIISLPKCDKIDVNSNQSIVPVDVQNLLSSFKILSTVDDSGKGQTLNFSTLFSHHDIKQCNYPNLSMDTDEIKTNDLTENIVASIRQGIDNSTLIPSSSYDNKIPKTK